MVRQAHHERGAYLGKTDPLPSPVLFCLGQSLGVLYQSEGCIYRSRQKAENPSTRLRACFSFRLPTGQAASKNNIPVSAILLSCGRLHTVLLSL